MDDYVIDGDLVFSDQRSALKFYREQYHKKKEWQGLTDDEINTAAYNNHPLDGIRAFARAVESKLKEKNGFS